jgi:hypothetical protein
VTTARKSYHYPSQPASKTKVEIPNIWNPGFEISYFTTKNVNDSGSSAFTIDYDNFNLRLNGKTTYPSTSTSIIESRYHWDSSRYYDLSQVKGLRSRICFISNPPYRFEWGSGRVHTRHHMVKSSNTIDEFLKAEHPSDIIIRGPEQKGFLHGNPYQIAMSFWVRICVMLMSTHPSPSLKMKKF